MSQSNPLVGTREQAFFGASLAERRPRIAKWHRRGTAPPAASDRADRLREHRLARGAGGAGLDPDQQVRRRLSGQALLWRLRVRRRGRDPGDRPRQAAVRLRLRQRPALLRQPGQPGRVQRADQAGRPDPRHEPRRRRPPHARRQRQPVRQMVQGAFTTACAARTAASISTKSRKVATEAKPKIIIAGGSAYSRTIDFAGFRADRRLKSAPS